MILLGQICFLFYFSIKHGYSQELIINETHVTAARNEEVKFEWFVKEGPYADAALKFYIGDSPNKDGLLLRDNGEPQPAARTLFGHRLPAAAFKGQFSVDPTYTYIVTIRDLQYNYTGSYYLQVAFFNPDFTDLNSTIKLNVTGGPEFCRSNDTSVTPNSELTVTLCGNPQPVVTWGLKKEEVSLSMTSVQRDEQEWYVHHYSLNYTDAICGKKLYFKAVRHDKSITWSPELEVNCEVTKVSKKSYVKEVVVPIIVVLMLGVIVVLLALYWKKKLCFKKEVKQEHGRDHEGDTEKLHTPTEPQKV